MRRILIKQSAIIIGTFISHYCYVDWLQFYIERCNEVILISSWTFIKLRNYLSCLIVLFWKNMWIAIFIIFWNLEIFFLNIFFEFESWNLLLRKFWTLFFSTITCYRNFAQKNAFLYLFHEEAPRKLFSTVLIGA